MYKALTLAGLAAAVSASYGYGKSAGPYVFRNYGGSTSGNRLVDDLHDAHHN